ncbi:MAG: 6-carboxytetrahydropterin synthase [Planctomycetota bacterium]
MEIRYQAEFCAAHRLFREDWSEQRNTEVFGICANPHGHGHNYQLMVCVRGPIQEETGMVMNFLALTALVQERILRWVDHRNLDLDVPFLSGKISTAENLLVAFWEQLEGGLPQAVALASLSLGESRDYSCHYYGPQA